MKPRMHPGSLAPKPCSEHSALSMLPWAGPRPSFWQFTLTEQRQLPPPISNLKVQSFFSLLQFISYFIPSALCCSTSHLQTLTLWRESSRGKNPEEDPFPWHFMHPALPTSLTSFPSLSLAHSTPATCPFCQDMPSSHLLQGHAICHLFPGMFSPQTFAPSQVCFKGTSPPLLIPHHLTLADFLLGMHQYWQFYNLSPCLLSL